MKTIFQVWELKNSELFIGGEKTLVGETEASTKRSLQHWIAYGGAIPTHMGELRKHGDGYIYFTTIGRTYVATKSCISTATVTK